MNTAAVILLAAIGARVLLEVNKGDAAGAFEDVPLFGGLFAESAIAAETENLRNGLDLTIVGAVLLWVS